MTYSHPNAAIAVPSTKPIIGKNNRSPITHIVRQALGIQLKPISVSSKIIGSGTKLIGPKIAITSIIRNEEKNGNLKRFLDCCQELETHHKNIIYIFIEGDSSDKTYDILKNWIKSRDGSILEKIDMSYPIFSRDRKIPRTIYFAELRNRLIELVLLVPDITEILMIDANYIWKCDIINSLREVGADIVAPLSVKDKDDNGKYLFYDIWVFRKNGKEFTSHYPYTEDMVFDRPIEIDSVGSGYLIKRKVLDAGARYNGDTDSEQVGFCHSARHLGFKIMINPNVYIRKGSTGFIKDGC